MNQLYRITDPEQGHRKPCFRSLRIRADALELLAAAASHEEILQDYPYLEPEDITAALQVAASIDR